MLMPSGRVMLSANLIGGDNAHSSPNPAQSTPRPPGRCGFATSTLRSCCAPPPSPAAPTKTTPAKLSWSLLHARRSRAFDAAHAPRQRLPQACVPGRPDGLRGVEHPASQAGKLDFFLSSTGHVTPSRRAVAHRAKAEVPRHGTTAHPHRLFPAGPSINVTPTCLAIVPSTTADGVTRQSCGLRPHPTPPDGGLP